LFSKKNNEKFAEVTIEIKKPEVDNKVYVLTGPKKIILNGDPFYTWKVNHSKDNWVVVDIEGVEPTVTELKEEDGTTIKSKVSKILVEAGKLKKRKSFNIQVLYKDVDKVKNFTETISIESNETVIAKFQIEDTFSAIKHFGKVFAKTFYCVKVIIKNEYNEPIAVESGSIKLPIFYVSKMTPLTEGDEKLETVMDTRFKKWFTVEYNSEKYKIRKADRTPMNFGAILSVVKYDQYHNTRSFAVRILRTMGVFGGAVAPFISADDLGEWISFFSGPVTAEFEKLLLADLVANLEFMNANAMHETLTIKEQGTASKYVFFPKGDVFGRWGLDLAVRILSIYTDPDKILSATVLRKQEKAEVSAPKEETK